MKKIYLLTITIFSISYLIAQSTDAGNTEIIGVQINTWVGTLQMVLIPFHLELTTSTV